MRKEYSLRIFNRNCDICAQKRNIRGFLLK